MKRASYRAAVAWVAMNDESAVMDAETISGSVTAVLIADLFGVEPAQVGRDVARIRAREFPDAR